MNEALSQRQNLWSLFEATAQAHPAKTAVVDVMSNQRLSYRDLQSNASAIGQSVVQADRHSSGIIPVVARRSAAAIAACLGILRANRPYLPIDPDFPASRVRYLLEDSGANFCLVEDGISLDVDIRCLPLRPEFEASINLQVPDNPIACVVYTSGSTGNPKGVLIPGEGVHRLLVDGPYKAFDATTCMLQVSAPTFDASIFELWSALVTGGTCVLYPPQGVPEPMVLADLISSERINTAFFTTSLFHQIAALNPHCLSGLQRVFVGGESLSPAHCESVYQVLPEIQIVNGYGPTENTVFTTAYEVPRSISSEDSMPIGFPLADTTVRLIVDGQEVTLGEPGEIYAGGSGVALGYLNKPEETEQKFVTLDQRRYYRTGDLGTMDTEGCLHFVGRIDGQMKVRGHRVEPGELEAHLQSHPGVRDCRVRIKPDLQGEKQLIAYYVASHDILDLRGFLLERLPKPIVPAFYLRLDALPLNEHGKLDEPALPNPYSVKEPSSRSRNVSDSTAAIVRRAWEKYVPAIDESDNLNFFDAGGTSLQSLALAEDLAKILGREVPVTWIFANPTVRLLSEKLAGTEDQTEDDLKRRAAQARSRRSRRKQRTQA